MSMIPKRLEEIDKNDILTLIEDGVPESKCIEYKSSLPGKSDEDKKEFLADVSSFANAGGGDILYGICESEGLPEKAVGIGISEDVDEAISRLENILRTGLDPRIQGHKMEKIEGFPEGPIIIIRIPNSWISPHMVKNNSRFFIRNNAGKHQMDTTELRQAFTQSQQIAERMRNFRDARLGKIFSGVTPVPMMDGPKLVLHLLPLVSFTTSFCLSAQDIEKEKEYLKPIDYYDSIRFNLDGFLTYNHLDPPSYCQFFRNGCIESVKGGIVHDPESDRKVIPGGIFDDEVVQPLISYFKAISTLDIPFPIYIFIALLGVKESVLATGRDWMSPFHDRNDYTLFEDWIITPEQEISDISQVGDREAVLNNLKPLYDVIWNAYGYRNYPE